MTVQAEFRRRAAVLLLTLLAVFPAASQDAAEAEEEKKQEEKKPPTLLGPVTREQIEEAEPVWLQSLVESELDTDAALALGGVEPGARVSVYFGTWCEDSQREIARFWRALDENFGVVPFDVEYIAVDRAEKRPPELAEDLGLRYVPTFVVERGGHEVGRMVEVAPDGIEKALLDLLTGAAEGVVSGRDDLGEEPE